MIKGFCKDCNKKLSSNKSTFCRFCYTHKHNSAKRPEMIEKQRVNARRRGCFLGEKNPNYRDGSSLIKKYCIDCKKELSRNDAIRCRQCSNKNIFYIHGNSCCPYPSEFFSKREKIFKRDDYKCQNCFMTDEEHIVINGTSLHVHHIDYNKFNNDENNLISLCSQCHKRTKKNKEFWKEKYQCVVHGQ